MNTKRAISHQTVTVSERRVNNSLDEGSFRQTVLAHIPPGARKLLRRAKRSFDYLRVQAPVSFVLGPQYRRSRTTVEIDITWSCNLHCYNCNRSCEQAPTGERMVVDQIQRFIDESIEADQHWKRLRLLGGEPTLHPQFFEIINLLLAWRAEYSPNTLIELTTNGYGSKVKAVLEKLPPNIEVDNTSKETPLQPFKSFNVAPADCPEYSRADYKNGCFVTYGCGIGLTPYGWYQCAVAGGIDRIFGFNIGRKKLPHPDDNMYDQMETLCQLCGIFKRLNESVPLNQTVKTGTWEQAYLRHRNNPPKLTRY